MLCVFFFQAEDGIRDAQESRGLGDVYKRQSMRSPRDTVSVSPSAHNQQHQRPSSHAGGYQPGESVALAPNRPGQWKPSTHNESLQLAQHPAQGTTRVKDAKEMLEQYLDDDEPDDGHGSQPWERGSNNHVQAVLYGCLLYTSDAADEEDSVDLGGRRIIKKKKKRNVVRRHNKAKKK
eukprot:TRINITY_DN22799_c0_g1_i1.p1 TRINITY_DN22799_c0_g1~~TRINITY_DN22799_c0_g1_i1.p1  ORF type:complete len:178 (-),score=51.45 TRINITY_DN22799_c0_g1_i1:46-579(-)